MVDISSQAEVHSIATQREKSLSSNICEKIFSNWKLILGVLIVLFGLFLHFFSSFSEFGRFIFICGSGLVLISIFYKKFKNGSVLDNIKWFLSGLLTTVMFYLFVLKASAGSFGWVQGYEVLRDSSEILAAAIAGLIAITLLTEQNRISLLREKCRFYGYLYHYFCQGNEVIKNIDGATFEEIKKFINENSYLAEKDMLTAISWFNEGKIIRLHSVNRKLRDITDKPKFDIFSKNIQIRYSQLKNELENKPIFT